MTKPSLPELLHAAVTAVGGTERPGQVTMAESVAEAIDGGSHLLVQAGTGTGKSLGYLVPALAHGERVVVATATLALQRQLVERDLPRTVESLHPLLRRRPEFAMLKGRSNYLCLHRLHEGVPQDEEEGLFDQFEAAAPTSKLGQDLLRVRDWADETETGDRDNLTPGISDRAWAQVSVSSRECLGASKCAYGAECFAEMARERAKLSDVVVTNHALLAIDAIEGAPVLPQHEVLIVDEAHELVSRVTGVATGELTPGQVNRAVRRAAKLVNEKAADQLQTASEGFERLMELALPGRLEEIPEDLGYALMALRDACRTVISAIGTTRDKSVQDEDAIRKQALASVENVHDVAERITNGSEWDVVWYERHDRFGASLRVAPMSVSGLLREKLFADRSVVLTSATLKLGGDFNGVGASLGLAPEGTEGDDLPKWKGIDVGSPFDYRKQGILYVAKHLARPARDGDRADMLDELTELIQAAGGRTLGLFSSMRGAQLRLRSDLRDLLPRNGRALYLPAREVLLTNLRSKRPSRLALTGGDLRLCSHRLLNPLQPLVNPHDHFVALSEALAADHLFDDLSDQCRVALPSRLSKRLDCVEDVRRQSKRRRLHRPRIDPLTIFHLRRRVMSAVVLGECFKLLSRSRQGLSLLHHCHHLAFFRNVFFSESVMSRAVTTKASPPSSTATTVRYRPSYVRP